MGIFFVVFRATAEVSASKLDRVLRLGLEREQLHRPSPLINYDNEGRVKVLIRTDSPFGVRKMVEGLGGKTGAFSGGILTGSVPVDALTELAGFPDVFSISASRRLKPLLDKSVSAISADSAHSGSGIARGVTGRDVIVGIVDTGVDFKHRVFKNSDESTRFLSIWDQNISGTGPSDFGYGTECDVNSINKGLCNEKDMDPDYSHGTHVTGIAAGSDAKYNGVAPGAMIVGVKTIYDEASVIDGVDYIFNLAGKYNKPAVVNLSLGGQYGPHDGTSQFDTALEALQGNGKIIVAAAGNDGSYKVHVESNVIPSAESWTVFDVYPNETDVLLEVWYNALDLINFAVAGLKDNQVCKTDFIAPGQSNQFTISSCSSTNCGNAIIDASATVNPNNSRQVYVLISAPSATQPLSRCRWAIGAQSNSADADGGSFDGWITTANAEFGASELIPGLGTTVPGDSNKTISTPADAKNIIAIGSFVTKNEWTAQDGNKYTCNGCTPGDISAFSSRGPTRDGRLNPAIAAPGEWVASSKSSNVSLIDSKLLLPDQGFFMLAGTSMASPHAAGAIALMLDWNPNLGPAAVKNYITANAKNDSFTGLNRASNPDNRWGHGKLDILKALQSIAPAAIDATPPQISDVVVNVSSDSTVSVSWKTDELSDSSIKASFGNGEEIAAVEMSFVTDHTLIFSGLETRNLFRLDISSRDPRGNAGSVTNLPVFVPGKGCGCTASGGSNDSFAPVFLLGLFWLIFRLKSRRSIKL